MTNTSIKCLIEQLAAPCKGIPSHLIEEAEEKYIKELKAAYNTGYMDRECNHINDADQYDQLSRTHINAEDIAKAQRLEEIAKRKFARMLINSITDDEIHGIAARFWHTNGQISAREGIKLFREKLIEKLIDGDYAEYIIP